MPSLQEHGWTALWAGLRFKGLRLICMTWDGPPRASAQGSMISTPSSSGPVEFTLVGFMALTPNLARQS